MGDQEPWSPKPLGWRLLFTDRLLWIALGLSFIAHLVILAPRYGIKLPERGDKSLTVSFRAATQATPHANDGGQRASQTNSSPSNHICEFKRSGLSKLETLPNPKLFHHRGNAAG